ncbi:MAG: IS256 family transposase, partial [Candidatus Jettenia sp.]|nr:IS256 family transposase [Candidatus Jettenia sp.]
DNSGDNNGNSRNGTYARKLKSSFGESEVEVPRDRKAEFEPKILPKYTKGTTNEFDNKIISLYAKGNSTRDIQDTIKDSYGVELSAEMVSHITDKILPELKEWQDRPLDPVYLIIYLDCIHIKIRTEGKVDSKAVYNCLGLNLEGKKEILGQWVTNESEGANFWLSVITDLQQRGVSDILIACVDGLKGFSDAIHSVFPKTIVQRCVIHQIRYSLKYVSWKDKKEFMNDLKPVYQATNKKIAEEALLTFTDKWKDKYNISTKSWLDNWEELSTFFEYPKEIRKLIYTTNIIEGYHRQVRKAIKTKGSFPTIESVEKMLYMVNRNISKKWDMPVRDWGLVLNQFMIRFEGRFSVS